MNNKWIFRILAGTVALSIGLILVGWDALAHQTQLTLFSPTDPANLMVTRTNDENLRVTVDALYDAAGTPLSTNLNIYSQNVKNVKSLIGIGSGSITGFAHIYCGTVDLGTAVIGTGLISAADIANWNSNFNWYLIGYTSAVYRGSNNVFTQTNSASAAWYFNGGFSWYGTNFANYIGAIMGLQSSNDLNTAAITTASNLLEAVVDTQTVNTAAITDTSNRVVTLQTSNGVNYTTSQAASNTAAWGSNVAYSVQTTQNTYRAFSISLSCVGTNDTNSLVNYWSSPSPYAAHITNIRWTADGTATGNLLRSSYLTAPSAWEGVVFSNLTTAAWAWSNYAVNIAITNGEILNYFMLGCTNNRCDLMGTKD